MYLESIFNSEDIIAQMPEEGRKFAIVDAIWKEIMTTAVIINSLLYLFVALTYKA
jgi:dynein heavy chain